MAKTTLCQLHSLLLLSPMKQLASTTLVSLYIFRICIDKRGNGTGNADWKLYKVHTDHVRFISNKIEENGSNLIVVHQHQQRFRHVGSETSSNMLRAVGRGICDVSSLVLEENSEISGCLSKYPFFTLGDLCRTMKDIFRNLCTL